MAAGRVHPATGANPGFQAYARRTPILFPLLPLPGLPGTKLSASADWLDSQVTDPFIGQRRPISGDST